ncbi:glycoside hydrolase family 2 protein [Pedobacter frigoris]|uniref:glycoside hydrolase family 2 protein n=1 Tax=Pedobacter frigoris TaxID=2571272 RepID=UPI00292D6F78|nr:glycoside hydrolase family 2 TIM barrel-domain containing protein [Pedobacter frigoris]
MTINIKPTSLVRNIPRFLFFLIAMLLQKEVKGQEQAYNLPVKTTGVKKPVLSLNGEWKFQLNAQSNWDVITVPGEAVMQGYGLEHDKSFFYKRAFSLPADFNGKKIIIRFDGVYSEATLIINGKVLRKHKGGFTRWETDITPYVSFDKANEVLLEIQDKVSDISYASGYAHHPIGGILRDVTLFATSMNAVHDFGLETQLDNEFRNAVVNLNFKAEQVEGSTIHYVLYDKKNNPVPGTAKQFKVNKGENVNSFSVVNPLKWDAEHPNLYRMNIKVKKDGKETYTFDQQVGFRSVKVVGDQLMVNGRPVKLRGANRHDVSPTLGRTTTRQYDSLDVILFKESHINFVRTSHYPPTERFVEFCNRYGIYVEVETAVCFVDTYRQQNYAPGATQNDPAYTDQYVGQCREMVNTFKTHPAVIIWSIGNESIYGTNFKKSWDYVKSADKSRPVIWSYPGSQKDGDNIYEILSMHYQDVNGNLSQRGKTTRGYEGHGIPALFDEWAHPPCYTYKTLRDDPNIREFWGISMDMMWGRLFPTKGGLGGAIWGYVDDIFMIPQQLKKGTPLWRDFAKGQKPAAYQGHEVGYGEWGIVDVWRRRKPEFWSTKKAQSPIRILQEGKLIKDFKPNQHIQLPVYNRYDHTNLNEVKLQYVYNTKKKTIELPDINPHEKGVFQLPAEDWKSGKSILLNFIDRDGRIVDTYEYFLGERPVAMPIASHKGVLKLEETDTKFIIKGQNFEIPVSKSTGLIENALLDGKIFIGKGPYLNMDINLNHLTGAEVRKSADKYLVQDKDWLKQDVKCSIQNGMARIAITGTYKGLKVYFDVLVKSEGEIITDYRTEGEPNGYVREIGIKYHMPNDINKLNWARDGYWNYYPEGDFAGNTGMATLFENKQAAYGQKPTQPWDQDTHNYYYWSDQGAGSKKPFTQKAKGMKENIYYYTISDSKASRMSVVSPKADVACRMDRLEDEQIVLYINNKWDYPEIAWGNYCKTLEASPCKGAITVRF